MLKGGVIMDVVSPEHAVIAEEAEPSPVMALERVPADSAPRAELPGCPIPGLIRENHHCVRQH